jgi:hypothetical protein
LIQGYNILIQNQVAHHQLHTFALLEDDERTLHRTKEIELVSSCLQGLDAALGSAHPELSVLPAPGYFEQQSSDLWNMPHLRTHIQMEILKIYLRVGLLQTRLFLTEALSRIEGGTSAAVITQYESMTRELVLLLKSLSLESLEPCRSLIVSSEPNFHEIFSGSFNRMLIKMFQAPILRVVALALRDGPKDGNDAMSDYDYLNLRFVELFGEF